jgi:serine protease AprX
VTSPGDDPYVITAGAADTHGTVTTRDDTVATWSGRQRFRGYAKPDVVAPGVSVVSLRARGSAIDVQHPEGRIGRDYFRGTGTSMSAALVTGSAAIVIAHHPASTPDDVKGALVDGAAKTADGAPAIDLSGADDATARPGWWQRFPVAFEGLGARLRDAMPWTASRWTSDNWNASRWTASRWTASRWTASRWTASRWTDLEWAASRWTDFDWTASRWTASRWTAEAWSAQTWG